MKPKTVFAIDGAQALPRLRFSTLIEVGLVSLHGRCEV